MQELTYEKVFALLGTSFFMLLLTTVTVLSV